MQDSALSNSAGFLDNVLTIKHFFERNDGPAFLFAVSDSFHVRKQVNDAAVAYCKDKSKDIGIVELIKESEIGFLTQLRQAKDEYIGGLILNNVDNLIRTTDGEFAYDINQMREGLIALRVPLLIWLTKESHNIFTHRAIDLYLRRDLSTLFFEDPVVTNHSGFIEQFTESARESADFEGTKMRIALFEQQLAEARVDDFSKSRLANEVVLPLIRAYVDNSMLDKAKKLLREFENNFDYNKTDADNIIAALFKETGDFDQAISHYEKALEKKIKIFGKENLNIANIYNEIGVACRDKGNLDKAIEYFEQALKINLKLFGEDELSVAIYYNNLSSAWQDKGNLDKAIEYLEKALKIDLKLLGEETTNVATRYSNLGSIWHDKGNMDKAIEYSEKALKIDLKLFGEETSNVAIRYNNLGLAWQGKGNLDKAIKYFEKALKINLKLFGEEHSKVAIRYSNLGTVWQNKGNLDKAIEYYEKALKIDIKLFDEENPKVAIRYNNLGMAWQDKGNLDKAIGYLKKAYDTLSKLYGEENPSTKIAKENYERCLRKIKAKKNKRKSK